MIKTIYGVTIDSKEVIKNFKKITIDDIRKFKNSIDMCNTSITCPSRSCSKCIFGANNIIPELSHSFVCGSKGKLMPFYFRETPVKAIIEYLNLLESEILGEINKLNI